MTEPAPVLRQIDNLLITEAPAALPLASLDTEIGNATDLPLTITESDVAEISSARLELALRALTRLMIRTHQTHGDPEANAPLRPTSSSLTPLPHTSPHHGDEAA